MVAALRAELDGAFESANVPVLYCGVGKVNAAIALTRELARYATNGAPVPQVVNFGSAGSRRFPAGELVECHEFIQRDMNVSGLGFPPGVTPFDDAPGCLSFARVFEHLPTAICGSGDSFATADTALECEVDGRSCAVVDMEAYALAKACRLAGAPFCCAKYVSDGADHAAASDWQQNVHRAADQFLGLYQRLAR